jgi:uncharacterized protein YegP (UPF0339 family)
MRTCTRSVGPARLLSFAVTALSLTVFAALLSSSAARAQEKTEARKLKFEVYQDAAKEYRWRLKAGNGEILATAGQGYKAKADAEHGVERIREAVGTDKLKFEVYEDMRKEYRWRLKATNGQTVAASSDGYKTKESCERAIGLIKSGAKEARVEEKP